jgi:hypothetical protein
MTRAPSINSATAPAAVGANKTMITLILTLSTVMQALDTTIVNVSLPHMEGSLGATQDQISWVLTSYIVAAAIMTPATSWLAGRIGRTRLLVPGDPAGYPFPRGNGARHGDLGHGGDGGPDTWAHIGRLSDRGI